MIATDAAIPTALSPATLTVDLCVIIISWNTRQILHDCLRSVFSNTHGLAVEVLVVDNASTDGSPEMVAADFPQAKLVRNAVNHGFAAANNQALTIATGRHVLLLNSDTIVLGEVMRTAVNYMDERREVGVLGCRVLNPDRTLQPTCFEYPSLLNLLLLTSGVSRLTWPRFLGKYQMSGWNRDSEREVEVVTGCFMLVRTEALRQVGLMDESFFFFGEETDWCRRFHEKGWRVCFSPVGEIIHLGGASARQLNHRRDVLLTEALIHLHRKHGGRIMAFTAWSILGIFNFSRCAGWTVAAFAGAVFRAGDRAAERRNHFRAVLRDFPSPWRAAEAAP